MAKGNVLVVVLGVVGAALVAGCSAAAPETPVEKVSAASEALITPNPTPPPRFPAPIGNADCKDRSVRTVLALPTTEASAGCSNRTAYTLTAVPSDDCARSTDPITGPTLNQHLSDLWSIPGAHGFRYKVQDLHLTCSTPGEACGPVGAAYFLQGIANWNKPYWYFPWQNQQGETAPWPATSDSHPRYGTDALHEDWLSLWNLAYTYASAPVSAAPMECVAVYRRDWVPINKLNKLNPMNVGGSWRYTPIDFFSAADDYDPQGVPW